ncbi:tetratricopeptide repeat protein [Parvularcula maris]|uniref:Tetratricopeptide repeat protein n=1 Tax=Parvularcula maris TaxID=2965077 RepID=A0A9X2RKZ8_9PROT|nr:hypothetical protein [Parvularcula maris]MCQ8186077.1 hypothetical protein [Parvularcula maris]
MIRKPLLTATAAVPAVAAAAVAAFTAPAPRSGPFLHPVEIARSLCGRDGDGLSKRRALFVSAAAAYRDTISSASGKLEEPMPHPNITLPIKTSEPLAQSWFDRGLADLFNFHHEAAAEAFRRAQKADPACAMCYWGEAFALGPNINAPMDPSAAPAAHEAASKAAALTVGTEGLEAALADALLSRYAPEAPADRTPLDLAFAEAMEAVAEAYPGSDFALTIAAEANMDTQPWDYWLAGGRLPKGRTGLSLGYLETVLERSPDYIPAIHLFIHMTEASTDPYRALPYADSLGGLSEGLGHLVHMPSHTYFRVGQYKNSLASNIEAVATDEALIKQDAASEFYEYGYYTHNIHFALTSAQMGGDGKTALAMAQKLDAKLPVAMAAAAPWVQPIKAASYYAHVQFAEPRETLTLPNPGDELPFLKAAWHYARGEAFARMGRADDATSEADAIRQLELTADFSDLIGGGVPAAEVLRVSELTVRARAAAYGGDLPAAITLMEEAVTLQDAMPYMEPPWWYYPARQTLAGFLLADGQTERAEQLFIQTLAQSPNNAWVLFGLSEVYAAEKDRSARRFAQKLFKDTWMGGKARPSVLAL